MIRSAAGDQTGGEVGALREGESRAGPAAEIEQPQIGRTAVALPHCYDQLSAARRKRRVRVQRRVSHLAELVARPIEPDQPRLFIGGRPSGQKAGPRHREIHLVAEPVVLHGAIGHRHGVTARFEAIEAERLRDQRAK